MVNNDRSKQSFTFWERADFHRTILQDKLGISVDIWLSIKIYIHMLSIQLIDAVKQLATISLILFQVLSLCAFFIGVLFIVLILEMYGVLVRMIIRHQKRV